jgi:hypothetical protein
MSKFIVIILLAWIITIGINSVIDDDDDDFDGLAY